MTPAPGLNQPLDRRQFLKVPALIWGLRVGLGFGASQASPSLDEYLRQFELSYHAVRTVKAEFTQTYRWGAKTRIESGIAYFARGGRMRWDYQAPNEKLFLSDGKELLLYVPAEKQLTRSRLKSSEDVRAPFRLLLSRLNLRKIFSRIEFADQAMPDAPEDHVLRAFPKAGREGYEEVLIELTPAFDVRRIQVSYPDRSVMDFEFTGIQRGLALDPGLFRFIPPAGAEVIEQ